MTLVSELQLGLLNQSILQIDELNGTVDAVQAPLDSFGTTLCNLYYSTGATGIILRGPKALCVKVADEARHEASVLYSNERTINIDIF